MSEEEIEIDDVENLDEPQTEQEDAVIVEEETPDKEIAQLQDELARARADVYNVQQEYGNYVRRTKAEGKQRREEGNQEVIELLLPTLDDIEAARAAGDLVEGPFASIADKLEDALATNYGYTRFGAAGDAFDPELHDALMAHTNPEVTETVISQVLQSGVKLGDQVLRPAKVIVDNPE